MLLSISFISTVLSFVFYTINLYSHTPYAVFDLAWIAIIICGFPIIKKGYCSLKNKKITSSVLISIALIASIIMGFYTALNTNHGEHESYFFVAGEIAFLMALGELIEKITSAKSRAAIEKLISLSPSKATLKIDNGYTEVGISQIDIGDIVLVRKDENIPVDGILVSEYASINQATLTGEPEPKDLQKGDAVYASTKNLLDPIEITVTKRSDETVLSKVIDYYKNAMKNKAPIAGIADKLASKLVPIALLTALLVFFITTGLFNLTEGLSRGLAILVVFCPCALALATPTALSATIGNASRRGILIKNGHTLEVLSRINTIAFDKTGTLTNGLLEVDQVLTINSTQEEMLFYVASAEKQSEHPIAKAILKYYDKNTVIAENTQITSGVGIKATVNNKTVEVMKLSYAEKDYPQLSELKKEITGAKTILAVIISNEAAGLISLKDNIKDNAPSTVSKLEAMGYETVLLTGDNKDIAKNVAETIGIKEYHYELLPLDKADMISQIQLSGNRVLMVGDGVNDAPAMGVSDVSVAMGSIGSEVAIEAADISFFNDDVSSLPGLMTLSKRGVNTIRSNIIISLALNFITVGLSAFGFLNAVWGAFFHNISSVLVCINSALILTKKDKR